MTRTPGSVLVVDAEPDFAVAYERLLRRRGYRVVTAASRRDGLATVEAAPLALVIADVRLPDGDGLDVIRAARATAPPTPAVVVTTSATEDSRRLALAAGAAGYLVKPFAIADFSSLMDHALGRILG